MAADKPNASAAAPRPSGPRVAYLTLYNAVFAGLWASILITAATSLAGGRLEVFRATEPRARWVQTLTLVEVLHAAVGECEPLPVVQKGPGL